MALKLQVGKYDFTPALGGPPKITDQLEAVCRTLEFTARSSKYLDDLYGEQVTLWYAGKRWFFGFVFTQKDTHAGEIAIKAYDPLIYLKKNPDDYYFESMTAGQAIKQMAEQVGVKVGRIEDTGAVLPALYYANKAPDKIAVDLIARTYQKNKKKFWYRFNPDPDAFGLEAFERVLPTKAWAFQYNVNLTKAEVTGSIEETTPIVRYLNRETGKEVLLVDAEALKRYGPMRTFKEVNKDDVDDMDKDAAAAFEKLKGPKKEMALEGINPEGKMPMFFCGDVIYAEERRTRLLGGYYVKNVTHTFNSDRVVSLAMDIQLQPDIPEVQYENQESDQKKIGQSGIKSSGGVAGSGEYNDTVKGLLDKYGLNR